MLELTSESVCARREAPAQGQQRRSLNYLFWRAAECIGHSLAATVEEGRTRRCVLKITRWELTTWVVFVAVSAVWRLEARDVAVWPQLHVSPGVGCR